MLYFRIMAAALAAMAIALGSAAQAQRSKLSADVRTAAKDGNEFAFDLYAQLRNAEKGNLFFSPYSISSALAMTYGGARTQTAAQMADTLHFTFPQNRLHPAYGDLGQHLNAKGKRRPYQLSVANALWGQKGFNFQQPFVNLTEKYYRAKLTELDFRRNAEAARQVINDWVEKETQEKIKNLIPKGAVNSLTRLVLTNAIYFKSNWQHKFYKQSTKSEDFTLTTGAKTKARMMHKRERINYMKNDLLQAVDIPYKRYGLSMIVLLPNKTNGLPALEKKLTAGNATKWLKQMKRHQVDLKLPKFKMTSKFGLKQVLSDMGMPLAFTPRADFSGMSTEDKLFIHAVLHKAYVDVNEEGTEAAAATGIIVGVTSAPAPLPRATFHADHPFVFLIRENQTGSILFMGRVTAPQVK